MPSMIRRRTFSDEQFVLDTLIYKTWWELEATAENMRARVAELFQRHVRVNATVG